MTGIAATAIIHTRDFVIKRFGRDRWAEVLERLGQPTRELLERQLRPRSWVDYDRVVDLLRAVKHLLGEQTSHILVELGKHNGEANLRITQRIIMRLASVDLVLRIAARLWKGRVNDGGTLKIVRRNRGRVTVLLSEFPDPQLEWHEYLVGWFTRTIELSGGRKVTVALTKSGSRPYETTEFECRWE
ncbi:MAG: hypothetical protein JW797_10155 [Bradymonadales bacterium]|nr:hypothetical protein [Bradymonadales bacterium]